MLVNIKQYFIACRDLGSFLSLLRTGDEPDGCIESLRAWFAPGCCSAAESSVADRNGRNRRPDLETADLSAEFLLYLVRVMR